MFSLIKKTTKQLPLNALFLSLFSLHGQALAATQGEQLESEALTALVEQGVMPALQRMTDTASALHKDLTRFCHHPTEGGLAQARISWKQAYLGWRHATPFMFGPTDNLQRVIGQWPVDGVIMDGVLRSEALHSMRRNSDLRGYAGVEFILFNYPDLQQVTANSNCEHLLDISSEIEQRTRQATQQWRQEFAPQFTAAGDGKPYLLANDALSLAYAEPLNLLERMLWNRIGIPSGFFEEPIEPEMLEAWRSRSTKQAMIASLEGLQLALNPAESSFINLIASKDGLVMKRDPQLAEQINRQLADSIELLQQIEPSVFDALQQDDALLQGLYKKLHKLQQLLSDGSLVLELNVRSFDENHID